jgi:hypothetical protein
LLLVEYPVSLNGSIVVFRDIVLRIWKIVVISIWNFKNKYGGSLFFILDYFRRSFFRYNNFFG